MRSSALVFVAFFALVGCPPTGLTTTCHFEGETTSCGQCLRVMCQSKIDGECASDLRDDGALANLDDCATGKGCANVISHGGLNGIGDCVKDSCSTFCSPTPTKAPSPTVDSGSPNNACSVDGEGCQCGGTRSAAAPSTSVCPTSSTASEICCATSASWAADASGACSCFPIGCLEDTSNADGATCLCGSYADRGKSRVVDSCDGYSLCCQTDDVTCQCFAFSGTCSTGQQRVSDCSTARLKSACDAPMVQVASCR